MTDAINASPVPRSDTHPGKRRGLYADCLRTYLRVVASLEDDRQLDRILLRTGSRRAVELLVLHTTHGHMRLAELLDHVEEVGSSLRSLEERVGGQVDPGYLFRIARVIALQDLLPDDRTRGLALIRWLYRQAGSAAFRPDNARLFQNLVFEAGEFAEATALVERLQLSKLDSLIMKADLASPFGPSSSAARADWEELFSRLFKRDGLEPPEVVVIPGAEPFDGLRCTPNRHVDDGPLVTVIVTSWHPGQGLVTAVRSLIAQSWRNLEILIVDDASPPEYRPLLEQVAAMDSRIRLVLLPQNGGTYNARNRGLRVARGEFIAGQDSDDWSHPRRIEKQVQLMLRKRRLVSTASHALRCDSSLVFNSPGTAARRENASSLMFRRQEVLDKVGFYDTTRKGGDTEFMLRIRRVFGERSHRTLEQNLALIRQSRGSLSTAEFRPGWRHPSRAAYRRSYEYWHATARTEALRLEGRLARPRSFPMPARFRIKAGSGADELNIVFADDLRGVHDPMRLRALLDEVRCALQAGRSVGLLHLRSFTDIGFERIDTFWTPFAELVHSGAVREVLSSDGMSPDVLVIRSPEVAMFLSPREIRLRPRKVLLAAEHPVRRGSQVWFSPEQCDRSLRDAFGRRPEWRAAAAVKRELVPLLSSGARVGAPYPVVVDARNWKAPRRQLEGRRPVLGRIAEGRPNDFPKEREELLEAYPPSGKLPTRFLGGEAALLKILGDRPVPKSWTLFPSGSIDPDLFLATCDFFVYFDRGARRTPPRRLIGQALAAGCVVLMPHFLAGPFGDAVVPVTPGEVANVVQGLAASPEAYRAQVDRGLELALRMNGASLFGGAVQRDGNATVAPASIGSLADALRQ